MPRKVVSNQFWCASLWPSPLLPGKLRPSPVRGERWPRKGQLHWSIVAKGYILFFFFFARSHLSDYMLPTRTPRCSTPLQRAEQDELPGSGVEGQTSQNHPAGNRTARQGSRLAAWLCPAPPRPLAGWGSGEQGRKQEGRLSLAGSNVAASSAGPPV